MKPEQPSSRSERAPTMIDGPLPGQPVEAYRKAHHGHLPGECSETDLRIEYIQLMQAHKRDFESLLEMHVRVLRDALNAPRSERGKRTYQRAPDYDLRIARGDDYAGDAYVCWSAVGHQPDDADIIKPARPDERD